MTPVPGKCFAPVKNLLILWDIDGTLTASGGAGWRALSAAIHRVFGAVLSSDSVDFAGRTDPWIVGCILERIGVEDTPVNRTRLLDAYLEILPGEVGASGRVLPGVRERLREAADRPDVAQALLTGNIRRGAEAKLTHHGLWHFFPFGAFADDGERRNDLGPVALRRAREHHGVAFAPDRVWIVGDTPHDIACARAAGIRVLAVATGSSPVEELRAHGPDAVLADLGDGRAFWESLGHPLHSRA